MRPVNIVCLSCLTSSLLSRGTSESSFFFSSAICWDSVIYNQCTYRNNSKNYGLTNAHAEIIVKIMATYIIILIMMAFYVVAFNMVFVMVECLGPLSAPFLTFIF